MIDSKGSQTFTQVLAAGTYSSNPTTSTGVDIRAYQGHVAVVLDAGASLTGTGTLDVRMESAGTLASGYAGVASSGTFYQVNSAGSFQSLSLDTDAHGPYLRAFATIGSSGRFPMSISVVGKKQTQ